ncbi:MAG TPA: NUDIX domain-containing protein, partial [Prolixibacteraceae bacterium]|nr:NUDIX domain-containing protein [Prolixibacteraceae bacterium]
MINSQWSEEEREQVPLVDETGRVTGCVMRSQVHNGSFLLHPVVHLHVLGPGNTLLLQKRPLHKDIQPGKWDTAVGGHISYGETPSEALVREAEEETGLVTFTPQLV